MMIIEHKILSSHIKYEVPESRWASKRGQFDTPNIIRDLNEVLKFTNNIQKKGHMYDTVDELISDVPSCDIDPRDFEAVYQEGYIVKDDEKGTSYDFESFAEALSYCVGDIPSRVIYKCKGNGKSLYADTFSEVVEFFYTNHKDFNCEQLNDEELQYIDDVRFYMFSTKMLN